MKVVILAGGKGSRLTGKDGDPKPLVKIGGMPIIWHVMKIYASFGYKEFIILTGAKGEVVESQLPFYIEPDWAVDIINTGVDISKAGRLKKVESLIDDTFMLTWTDGVADINVEQLLQAHKSSGKQATVTAIKRPARFGYMQLEGDNVSQFSEKEPFKEDWINGAFFVLEPDIFNYIDSDKISWEREILQTLIEENQLNAYRHQGFWQCMDTPYDQLILEHMWKAEAKWKLWD